ncbi:MAG: nicotinate phosphoribosyltransferase [Alphaproteobacteria bacterium]|nr:nicotinate phosphoribosyltransferase [Alphaproteobacteria bacterium]
MVSASSNSDAAQRGDLAASPLLTDLYQFNMMQAYLDHGMTATAVFEFFVRKLPPGRGFMLAAGLEQVLQFLETLRFDRTAIDWLRATGRFHEKFLGYLADLRFDGDVHAMPEGRVFFPNEPILRIAAPLPIAQLVETRVLNLLHFQSLIATKAARMVLQAPGKLLVDFGLRRAHGAEAGLLAARAAYIAGFGGTATVSAGAMFGIPLFGTMAHSFVQTHDDEVAAFKAFSLSRPDNLVLLIDTYDTVAAAAKVVRLVPWLRERGIEVKGVRLDSGDLAALSRAVRRCLDEAGLKAVTIFASGGIDETRIADLLAAGAPIDGFGVGTALTTSEDAPAMDCAYKLQEYAGVARRKLSAGKVTWPGRKQVFRRRAGGRMEGDLLTLADEGGDGTPLIADVMRGGRRLASPETLAAMRDRCAGDLERLPPALRKLAAADAYPVAISPGLRALAASVDRAIAAMREREQGTGR